MKKKIGSARAWVLAAGTLQSVQAERTHSTLLIPARLPLLKHIRNEPRFRRFHRRSSLCALLEKRIALSTDKGKERLREEERENRTTRRAQM